MRQLRKSYLHWDGTQWQVVPSPSPGLHENQLNAVTALAANDVWAVGWQHDSGSPVLSLIEHWDGQTWTVVPSPGVSGANNQLWGITALGPQDVWAVGTAANWQTVSFTGLLLHWDGQIWSRTSLPVTSSPYALTSIASLAPDNIWVVGSASDTPGGGGRITPLAMHWDGVQWTTLVLPDPLGWQDELDGVAAIRGPDIVWAIGNTDRGDDNLYTLIERDPALGRFADVPFSHPFYAYVECLAGRSIVNGYACGGPGEPCDPPQRPYFRPGNPITRGQLAKFIVNAANYQDAIPSTQQTFTDVPPGSPFWIFVERAVLHGVISGYTSSPPCTTGVPCFLPGNAVTRSQAAKFVSQAASYQDPIPSTQQTFTDVAPSNAFWVYVERAVLHGVISGYTSSPPCTTGVPCFLAGNGVTRGQTAKFIANAFFPNCQTPAR